MAARRWVQMKGIGVIVFLGVLLSLPVVYYLSPLNGGAIALVIFLSVGLVTTLGEVIKFFRKPNGNERS
jgi:hypothetical protein